MDQGTDYKIEGEYCPSCLLGQIVKRNGAYSNFLACNRYPRCNFLSTAKPKLTTSDKLELEADDWLENNKEKL